MQKSSVSRLLTFLGTTTAHPAAFLVVFAYAGLWLLIERDTFDMHGLATLIVWVMTLFIQRSEHRDIQALHAKVDELLRSDEDARSDIAAIDRREPEEIEEHRSSR